MKIGDQIAKYRKERQITQEQLGETVGILDFLLAVIYLFLIFGLSSLCALLLRTLIEEHEVGACAKTNHNEECQQNLLHRRAIG